MKKFLSIVLAAVMMLSIVSFAQAEELTGIAKGFAGEVTVVVTVEDGKITAVTAKGDNETPGIGTRALEELPAKIVAAGNTEVDVVAGATQSTGSFKTLLTNIVPNIKAGNTEIVLVDDFVIEK